MSIYYEDDQVTLHLADCREELSWLDADVLVTDPPYGIGWRIGNHPKRGSVRRDGIQGDSDTSLRDTALLLWGERPGIVFGTWAAPFPPYTQVLIWRKSADAGVIGSTTGWRRDTELIFLTGPWPKQPARWSSVLTTDRGIRSYLRTGVNHPHAKPLELMQTLVGRAGPGVIADPFAGIGTTLVAAKILGRRAVGVEVEEGFCETAARRLQSITSEPTTVVR